MSRALPGRVTIGPGSLDAAVDAHPDVEEEIVDAEPG